MNSEFIAAFARIANLSPIDADSHWAAFSRQLSDSEREEIESGGVESGEREGAAWLALL